MTRQMIRAVVVAAVAAAIGTGTAGAITPANGGDVGGSVVVINNGSGIQDDPHVSGDLAVYTNNDGTSRTIHYFDFTSAIDRVVATGALGDNDFRPDVEGRRIVFSRTRVADGQTASWSST